MMLLRVACMLQCKHHSCLVKRGMKLMIAQRYVMALGAMLSLF